MSARCRFGLHRWHTSDQYIIARDRHGWPVALGARWCVRCGRVEQVEVR